jgi:hypothetical protein
MAERYHAEMADDATQAIIAVTMDGTSLRVTATEVATDGSTRAVSVPMTRRTLLRLQDSIGAMLRVDDPCHPEHQR